MKRKKSTKIVILLLLLLSLTTGCTKYLSDDNKKRITNEKTGQSLTSNILCQPEEKELLAEELGHYYCNAFYNSNSDFSTISKKEYRANKWKCTVLVSVNDFIDAFKKGLKNVYEIAEYLNLSEDTVAFAYNYYKENSYI